MIDRRGFLRLTAAAGAGYLLRAAESGRLSTIRRALAATKAPNLSDPALQPKFQVMAPNALAPGFIFAPMGGGSSYDVTIAERADHHTGLVNGSTPVPTPIWGYGPAGDVTWPGRTFEVQSGATETTVTWRNQLGNAHLLPVDTSFHWSYSLDGYDTYTIADDGVPIITHLHGGHTDFQFDGNPEFFYSPGGAVYGPSWNLPGAGGFTMDFVYDNDVPAGTLWYHDHALGITRLNVYAGLAGFYIIRDAEDTGEAGNPLGLPAYPYELAYAVQDRMFYEDGRLFYPAFPGDPFYDDFITGEGVVLPPDLFPGGGPTILAEFFGDHMVVNGKIWPKEDVMPRNYRMRLLNGTDSRFMVLQFVAVNTGDTDFTNAGDPIPFHVIGSDQGLAASATMTDMLVFEPGSRYDVVFDFKGLQGKRIIMKNIGGDEPFGGDIPGPQVFGYTDRVMAFDVADVPDQSDAFDPAAIDHYGGNTATVDRVRKLALFEGGDRFGRLQPLLGTAEPATDHRGNPINWPDEAAYQAAGLVGQMEGSMSWHSPVTENPALDSTEIWEIYNATEDAHPIHLHLVNFEVLDRQEFEADTVPQPLVEYDGSLGEGARLEDIELGAMVPMPAGYTENAPKDMVTALPEQVTRIKATFDKPGRYVWHCHILSHEDHEMMRILHVGEMPREIFLPFVVKES
jgi:FtsP/CotA-like multicopper oxidase with cupredoxin domain